MASLGSEHGVVKLPWQIVVRGAGTDGVCSGTSGVWCFPGPAYVPDGLISKCYEPTQPAEQLCPFYQT